MNHYHKRVTLYPVAINQHSVSDSTEQSDPTFTETKMVALENISSGTTVEFTHLLEYVQNSTQVNEFFIIKLKNPKL